MHEQCTVVFLQLLLLLLIDSQPIAVQVAKWLNMNENDFVAEDDHLEYARYNIGVRTVSFSCSIKNCRSRMLTRFTRRIWNDKFRIERCFINLTSCLKLKQINSNQ